MLENFHDNVAAVGPISNSVTGQQNTSFNKGNKNLIEEDVSYLIGFCMLIKRSAIDALIAMDGYFIDERFGIGGSEEIDLCIRLRKAGYSLTIDRRVYVHHFCHASLKQVIPDLNAFHIEKHAILVEKWSEEVIAEMFPPQPKILIGIPCLSEDVAGMFFQGIIQQNISYTCAWERKTRMMPDQARNTLAQIAIDNGFNYVLFIDDDMVLDDQGIINTLIDTAVKKDLDILCSIAHTRNKPYFPCTFKLDPPGTAYVPTDFFGLGVSEVDAAGFSCAIINVRVFKKIPPPWFEFKRIKILGAVGPQGYGEDIYFSRKATEFGFKIHVHGDISIWHIGGKILINRDTWVEYNNGMQPMFNKIKMLV
jgi:GT2 family glycosyltransferase